MKATAFIWKIILWSGILLLLGTAGASDAGEMPLAHICICLACGATLSLFGGYRLSRCVRKNRRRSRVQIVLSRPYSLQSDPYGGEAA